jgi:phospholipase/carboxylesterase
MNIYSHPGNPDAPANAVLLLHGYGADGQDLLGLADAWQDELPNTAFISCDAPLQCEMGFGYQWFSLRDWSQPAMAAGARDASAQLRQVVDAVLARYNLTPDKLVLAGFSQGTMMSLYTGLRMDTLPAGILGYSGALLSAETLPSAQDGKPPICLIHGEADTIVPVAASIDASRQLKELGYDVSLETIPMLPHGIDQRGLVSGLAFLQRVLG